MAIVLSSSKPELIRDMKKKETFFSLTFKQLSVHKTLHFNQFESTEQVEECV